MTFANSSQGIHAERPSSIFAITSTTNTSGVACLPEVAGSSARPPIEGGPSIVAAKLGYITNRVPTLHEMLWEGNTIEYSSIRPKKGAIVIPRCEGRYPPAQCAMISSGVVSASFGNGAVKQLSASQEFLELIEGYRDVMKEK